MTEHRQFDPQPPSFLQEGPYLKPLVYLACPYSSPDRDIRVARFEAVNKMTAVLMNKGLSVFSPISMSHPIAEQCSLPGDWQFWAKFDTDFISCCNTLYVLTIPGWKESTGVTAEIGIAEKLGIPVIYLDPE